MSQPQDGNGWNSPLTEIDPEDSVSNMTLVRAATPPRDGDPRKSSGLPTSFEPATASVTEPTKRKRTSLVFDGVVPPARKRKTTSTPAQISPIPAPPPDPVSPVNEEEAQAPQQTSTTLEPMLLRAITTMDGLNVTIGEQNKRIEDLVQDNNHLRDEVNKLTQTFQLSKRDLQRVENTIPKLTVELKTKFEKMLEKTEDRIQAPIDRLLEELGRVRANPPTPVHVSSITTFPQNTQFVPESQAECEGSWAPQEDYNPPGPSVKQHYLENCEPHVQPVRKALLSICVADPPSKPLQNNNYGHGRGGYRQFRGRGRGSRGGYAGNRHPFYQRSYPPLPEGWQIVRVPPAPGPSAVLHELAPTPVPIPATGPAQAPATTSTSAPVPTSTPAPTPAPGRAIVSTPRRSDSYLSQGPPPPPPSQQSHAYSHPYPQSHTHSAPPAPYDTDLPTPPRHRPARLQAYDRDRDCDREPSPPPTPARGTTYTDRAPPPPRQRSRSFGAYRDNGRAAPSPAPTRPRSHSTEYVEYRDDDGPRARSEAPDDAYRSDGGRYADDSAGYSPVRSDEQAPPPPQQQPQQQHWTASPSVSPSEHAVHHRHRRYRDDYRQQQQQRHNQNQNQQLQQRQRRWVRGRERSSSHSRTGSQPESTSESRGYVRRGGTGSDTRGGVRR
ncbi:hypothetical protein EI94DRAFT_1803757 [Lactarius quietus]|nr:hypothetical protein EI94DRAFT_1803757 [Lactarius quietus]